MRGLIRASAAFASVALLGCPGPIPGACEADGDCGPGSICSPRTGTCVLRGDAGTTCEPACGAHQQCDGTRCEDRYVGIRLTLPEAGEVFAPGAQVQVSAELIRVEGRDPNPPESVTLQVTAPGGGALEDVNLTHAGGEAFEGTLELGTMGGGYTLRAVWTGTDLQSLERTVTVDGAPPVFDLALDAPPTRPAATATTTWEDPMGNAFRRDERLGVVVTSEDADVDPGTVSLGVSIEGGAPVQVAVNPSASCTAPAEWCATAEVDLSAPEMKAFRGDVTVTVSGADLVGNTAAPVSRSASVTRWKWVYAAGGAPTIHASPVIGPLGTVLLGTRPGSSSGHLIALEVDGSERWAPKALGAISGSPSVGATGTIYVAAQDSTGAGMWAFDVDGNPVEGPCRPTSQGSVEASPFVTMTQLPGDAQPVETAVTVTASNNWLVSIRPGATAPCLSDFAADSADFPGALSGNGTDVYFGDLNNGVQGYSFGGGGWAPKSGWPVTVGPFPRALALAGTEVAGGAGTGLFTVPDSGGSSTSWEATTTSPAWNPSVGQGNLAAVGLNNSTLLATALGAVTPPSPVATDGVVKAAPLFGEGGRLYLASTNGTLMTRATSAPAEDLWSTGGLGALEASPNIDCTRDATGQPVPGAPGVLYVASSTGKVYAFIVDSRGVDADAPWPMYQHDPRHTGNAATSLEGFRCP